MTDLTTFYIVRHGQTEANVKKLIHGHTDLPLTEKGVEDIKKMSDTLKDIKFDLIFSSDLLRAKQTAEILSLNRRLEVKTSQLLREKFFGEYENKHESFYTEEVRDLIKEMTDEEAFVYTRRGTEPDTNVLKRFTNFLRETALAYPGKTILIATHGTLLRIFLIQLGAGNYQTLRHGTVHNGAYVVVDSDGVDFFIKKMEGVHPYEA